MSHSLSQILAITRKIEQSLEILRFFFLIEIRNEIKTTDEKSHPDTIFEDTTNFGKLFAH